MKRLPGNLRDHVAVWLLFFTGPFIVAALVPGCDKPRMERETVSGACSNAAESVFPKCGELETVKSKKPEESGGGMTPGQYLTFTKGMGLW